MSWQSRDDMHKWPQRRVGSWESRDSWQLAPEKGWESRDDWHKTSGWRDFKDGCGIEEESSWKEREGDSAGESTDQMKSLAVLQREVQGMKNCLQKFAEHMEQTEVALQTTKEEACEAKERIVTVEPCCGVAGNNSPITRCNRRFIS